MTKTELQAEKASLQTAIKNVLEGGQEFQTRNARVKQASLDSLQSRLATVESELAQYDDGSTGMTTHVLLQFGGCR